MSTYVKCHYIGCDSNNKTNSELRFFCFPTSDKKRCCDWIASSGRGDFIELPEKIVKNKRICSKHFEGKNFTNSLRNKLNKNAVPKPHYKENESSVDYSSNLEIPLPLMPKTPLKTTTSTDHTNNQPRTCGSKTYSDTDRCSTTARQKNSANQQQPIPGPSTSGFLPKVLVSSSVPGQPDVRHTAKPHVPAPASPATPATLSTPPSPSPPEDDGCISVKWNSYASNMSSIMPLLLADEKFVDVTLACDGQFIKCHKVILGACSTYFEELLSANPCEHPIILMKDFHFWELQAIVDFIYRGVVNIQQEKLPELLQVASVLQIKGLTGSGSKPYEAAAHAQDSISNVHGRPEAGSSLILDQINPLAIRSYIRNKKRPRLAFRGTKREKTSIVKSSTLSKEPPVKMAKINLIGETDVQSVSQSNDTSASPTPCSPLQSGETDFHSVSQSNDTSASPSPCSPLQSVCIKEESYYDDDGNLISQDFHKDDEGLMENDSSHSGQFEILTLPGSGVFKQEAVDPGAEDPLEYKPGAS